MRPLSVVTQAFPLRLMCLCDFSNPPAERRQLQGHMSRANPHWRLFEQDGRSLVIFAGPHAYVSPRWYDHVNVPTWNYVAVHVYGKPRLVTDAAEMHELMKGLVDRYEGGADVDARYTVEGLPADFLESQMKGIVGLRDIGRRNSSKLQAEPEPRSEELRERDYGVAQE